MKTEPIGEAVQSRHLANRHATRVFVVDRARAREGASRRIGARPQGVGHTRGRQFEKPRDRLDLARLCCRETRPRNVGVLASCARSQEFWLPKPRMRKMPGGGLHATQFPGVVRRFAPSGCSDFIRPKQRLERLRIRQITERILARRPARQPQFRSASGAGRQIGRIGGRFSPLFCSEKEQAFPVLRDAVSDRVQNQPREAHLIAAGFELSDQLFEKLAVMSDRQALDIFENKIVRFEFRYDADVIPDQAVARIIEGPLADHGKPLARRSATDHVNLSINASDLPDVLPS